MTSTQSNIPKIGAETRVSRKLQRCFVDLVAQTPQEPHLYADLTEQGWHREGGFNLARVLRRVTLWRHAKIGILTAKGYSRVYRYCLSQNLIGPSGGFMDGAVSWRSHLLRHDRWPDATVLVVEGNGSRANRGHSAGLWLFLNEDSPFLDAVEMSDFFNGSGGRFFTPSGNRRQSAHEWQNPSRHGGIYGRWYNNGRDWSEKEMYVDRFFSRMLPSLNLPERTKLYSVVSHMRAY